MSVASIVILAVAIPAMIVAVMLPPLLLHARLQAVSGGFPHGLRVAIGLDREPGTSLWEWVVAILFPLLFFLAPIQNAMALMFGLMAAVYGASRGRAYLKAGREFAGVIDPRTARLLLLFGLGGWALFLLLMAVSAYCFTLGT